MEDEEQWPLLQSKQQGFNNNGLTAGVLCLSHCKLSSYSVIRGVLVLLLTRGEEKRLLKGKSCTARSHVTRMNPEEQKGKIKEITS